MAELPHPIHQQILDAIAALPDTPARAALDGVAERHKPERWKPDRDWVTCLECALLAWPPPVDKSQMWSDVVYPCATMYAVAEALGVDVPSWEDNQASKRIETLIERSSLGTAEAVLLRSRVPDDVVARVLERAQNL